MEIYVSDKKFIFDKKIRPIAIALFFGKLAEHGDAKTRPPAYPGGGVQREHTQSHTL